MSSSYLKVKTLDPPQAAYVAGLIDGEGTITLSTYHRNENRRVVVSISNTELPLLEYVLQVIGAGRITKKCTRSDNHTPSFTYQIDSRQALDLLKQVAPHLRTYKAKRASLILKDYVSLTPRNGKYSSEMKQARRVFEETVLSIKANAGYGTFNS